VDFETVEKDPPQVELLSPTSLNFSNSFNIKDKHYF